MSVSETWLIFIFLVLLMLLMLLIGFLKNMLRIKYSVNIDFRRFSAILIGIFLVISACSLDVFETLRISELDREQFKKLTTFIS